MIIIGIDPGFASLGWAVVEALEDSESLLSAGLVRTKKSAKKQNVLAADDNVRRGRAIATELGAIAYPEPRRQRGKGSVVGRTSELSAWANAHVVAVEGQSWPRNASASAKVGHAWGVVIALATIHDLSIVQSTPMQVKRAVCGKSGGKATKAQVIDALCLRPGFAGRLEAVLDGHPGGQHEHIADACASAIAALDSEIVRTLRKARR